MDFSSTADSQTIMWIPLHHSPESNAGESDTASDGECTAVEGLPTRVIVPLYR